MFLSAADMVKLTAELIEQAAQYTNPVRDRELDLRGEWRKHLHSHVNPWFMRVNLKLTPVRVFVGYKIPVLENLGATLDQFDTIDLSDNEVRKLDGFPLLKRLKTLLINNNRIWWESDEYVLCTVYLHLFCYPTTLGVFVSVIAAVLERTWSRLYQTWRSSFSQATTFKSWWVQP